jgi:hypothetical protein
MHFDVLENLDSIFERGLYVDPTYVFVSCFLLLAVLLNGRERYPVAFFRVSGVTIQVRILKKFPAKIFGVGARTILGTCQIFSGPGLQPLYCDLSPHVILAEQSSV